MSATLTPLPVERFARWRAEARQRIISRQQDSGLRPGADAVRRTDALFDDLLGGAGSAASDVFAVRHGGLELGTVWTTVRDGKLFVLDLELGSAATVSEEGMRATHDAVLDALCALAASQGATRLTLNVHARDAEARAFVSGRGFEVVSIQMLLEPLPQRSAASAVTVSPMTAERFPRFTARSTAVFADELVASGRYDSESALAEARRQMAIELPGGLATEGQHLMTAAVDGVEVGLLWVGRRERGGRPHAFVLDIEIHSEQRGKGHGRALMHAAEELARDLGAESVGLHVFGRNAAAVRLYESLGYRRVEEIHLLPVPLGTGSRPAR